MNFQLTYQLKQAWDYALSAVIIWLCLQCGKFIHSFFDLHLPASIIGMLILFFGLISGLLKLQWVQATANLLLRYLLLIFLPISVGIMEHFQLLIDNALPLLIANIGVSTLVLIIISLLLQKILASDVANNECANSQCSSKKDH